MEQINISELRSNLLKYLKKAQSGSPFSVTSNGEVLATISSLEHFKRSAKQSLKELSSNAEVGDVVTPIDSSWGSAK